MLETDGQKLLAGISVQTPGKKRCLCIIAYSVCARARVLKKKLYLKYAGFTAFILILLLELYVYIYL